MYIFSQMGSHYFPLSVNLIRILDFKSSVLATQGSFYSIIKPEF